MADKKKNQVSSDEQWHAPMVPPEERRLAGGGNNNNYPNWLLPGMDGRLFPNDTVISPQHKTYDIVIDEVVGEETDTHHVSGNEVDAEALAKNMQRAFDLLHKRIGQLTGNGEKEFSPKLGEFHLGFERNDKPVFDVGKKDNDNEITVQEARVKAFLRMLRVGEGTTGEKGYTTLYSGKQFKDLSTHPQTVITANGLSSSAAGAYQIMGNTYKELNGHFFNKKYKRADYREKKNYIKKYGVKDFSPESQDLLALIILKEKDKGALNAIVRGDFMKALDITSKEWASLPDSTGKGRYGQPIQTLKKASDNYTKFLQEELKGKSELHLQRGFLHKFGY